MIIYLLKKFFSLAVGNLSNNQKAEFWNRFNTLLSEIVKAGAAGMVEGVTNKSKKE